MWWIREQWWHGMCARQQRRAIMSTRLASHWGKDHDTEAFRQLVSMLDVSSPQKMATQNVVGKDMWIPRLGHQRLTLLICICFTSSRLDHQIHHDHAPFLALSQHTWVCLVCDQNIPHQSSDLAKSLANKNSTEHFWLSLAQKTNYNMPNHLRHTTSLVMNQTLTNFR